MTAFRPARMRFGIFLAPFHRIGENPTLALERDLELVEHLDRMNFDEAWIGEHHSAGWETIASPELMIAALARSTRTIHLGTGVSSLPYHHPLILADRMVQLDHMTRGRAMFGVGPGALASDATMLGIDPLTLRARMDEALSAILPLLQGEAVTMKTDWFTLNNARLQLPSFSHPHLPVFVSNMFSPAGPTVSGKYGLGLISLASSQAGGMTSAAGNWDIASASAEKSGARIDRSNWRVMLSMHLSDTKQQAEYDIRERCDFFYSDYFGGTIGNGLAPIANFDSLVSSGSMICGTPDDAIEAIERVIELTGGIGGVLFQHHEFTTWEKTKHSYELWGRYVAPHFQNQLQTTVDNRDWVRANREVVFGQNPAAVAKAFADAGQPLPEGYMARMQRGRQ